MSDRNIQRAMYAGKMRYGSYYKHENDHYLYTSVRVCVEPQNNYFENHIKQLSLDHGDVMNSIGKRDKNETLIFERDILKVIDGEDRSTEAGFDWEECINYVEVFWNEEELSIDFIGLNMLDQEVLIEEIQSAEVVGNALENPELLEKVGRLEGYY